MTRRPALLDASFLIALERETARGEEGPARLFLPSLRGRPIVVSVVTVEEVLEGAADDAAAMAALQRFAVRGLHMAQARRCALLQRRSPRRMGENDAWLVATPTSSAPIAPRSLASAPGICSSVARELRQAAAVPEGSRGDRARASLAYEHEA